MHIEKRYSDPSIDRNNYRRFSFPIQYEILISTFDYNNFYRMEPNKTKSNL
jgi:hypothetical protein